MMIKTFVMFFAAYAAVGSAAATQPLEAPIPAAKIDIATAPVGSLDELREHLATTPGSPIYKLSESARSHFVASLVFTSQGLGSYAYTDLAGLSITDAYKVLALFGVQSTLGTVPGLRSETALDEAIGSRMTDSSRGGDDLVVPMADPRNNTICEVHPNHGSACIGSYGHHCTDGCG